MKHIERRIKKYIHNRPGATLIDIASYLGKDPITTKRILYSMKKQGLIVGRVRDNTNDVVGKTQIDEVNQ